VYTKGITVADGGGAGRLKRTSEKYVATKKKREDVKKENPTGDQPFRRGKRKCRQTGK